MAKLFKFNLGNRELFDSEIDALEKLEVTLRIKAKKNDMSLVDSDKLYPRYKKKQSKKSSNKNNNFNTYDRNNLRAY